MRRIRWSTSCRTSASRAGLCRATLSGTLAFKVFSHLSLLMHAASDQPASSAPAAPASAPVPTAAPTAPATATAAMYLERLRALTSRPGTEAAPAATAAAAAPVEVAAVLREKAAEIVAAEVGDQTYPLSIALNISHPHTLHPLHPTHPHSHAENGHPLARAAAEGQPPRRGPGRIAGRAQGAPRKDAEEDNGLAPHTNTPWSGHFFNRVIYVI